MYINRKITGRLEEAIRYFPAVVVTGARQIGKTTLIKKLLPDHTYVTLDRPFLKKLRKYIISVAYPQPNSLAE